jgi:serine/threonine protein kinase
VSASPWASALLGHQVGNYRLDAPIGDGGFGLVYRGIHVGTSASAAVKILDPGQMGNPQIAAEFQNEGVLLQKLIRRSHVINWIDSGTQAVQVTLGGIPVPLSVAYHVMSIASGSLDELTSNATNLRNIAWDERIAHWRGAILGTHQMHLSRVAHRDLKAANCLLMAGARNTIDVRLTDLGKSKDFTVAPTLPPHAYLLGRGDLGHAAPEYLYLQGGDSGDDFKLADLYGLGSLLAELATGHSMTSLALGSWRDVVRAAQSDFAHGVTKSLSTLRPQYRKACSEAVEDVPPAIRDDVESLLLQLCSPVPIERLPRRTGKRVRPDGGITWLIQKADILGRRLSVDRRVPSYKKKRSNP